MNEYLEAINRLEMPERPPNIRYIRRIPFMDVPDYTTAEHYNRILNESKFTKLPKYSISQRFYIREEDLGESIYQFDLDKSFVNAAGDRKSIAVRNIAFNSPFEDGKLKRKDWLNYMQMAKI